MHIRLIEKNDSEYPESLRHMYDAPEWLYVRGELKKMEYVAVVGTRQLTAYAKRATFEISQHLATVGVGVVSGLAFGVDAEAHGAAVAAGGVTVAVLGSGVNRISPVQHEALAERIIASGGAIVSEYPLDRDPQPYHFPYRNRIIGGLARATVVVAAGEKSGALITARYANEEGRDVFAVPGSIFHETSLGCHRLIHNGAQIVESPDAIVRSLNILHDRTERRTLSLTDNEQKVYAALSLRAMRFDEIANYCALQPPVVAAILTTLETGGAVYFENGTWFIASAR